jgi:hypothetical protein
MKAKHRREITYEAHETTVIRYGRAQSTVFCRVCGAYASGISMAQAMTLLSFTTSVLESSIRDGRIHVIVSEGRVILCANSLRALLIGDETDE